MSPLQVGDAVWVSHEGRPALGTVRDVAPERALVELQVRGGAWQTRKWFSRAHLARHRDVSA